MPRAMTPGGVIRAALRDDVLPSEAVALGQGWVGWETGDLAYRAVVSRDGECMRWRVFVEDARLGPAMESYGRLSVPVDPVDQDLDWPDGSRLRPDAPDALQAVFRDVLSLVRDRRELAQLMMEPDSVRRGAVAAWLPASSWPGRLAQALVIATDLDDQLLAAAVRDRIKVPGSRIVSYRPSHGPDVPQAERDRLDALYLDQGDLEQDVRGDAQHWLKQYARALNRPIPL
jgi:hypothetical protein